MADCVVTLEASDRTLPSRIADLLTGVMSMFDRNPEFSSSTIELLDTSAAEVLEVVAHVVIEWVDP
jgi:hypothetical protein